MKKWIVVALLSLTAGCSSTPPESDPAPASTAASAPTKDDVQMLSAYPTADYDDLGVVQFTFFRAGIVTPSVNAVLAELKAKVREAGGNAFILLAQSPDRDDKRVLHINAEVLKLK